MSFRKRPDLRPVSRFMKNIPLWERPAFRYPIYRPGNPQTRLFLPQFWMKILRDERNRSPPNSVHFEVHREMGKHDIRQYLEKIYEVKILKIRTYTLEGNKTHERSNDEPWLRTTFTTTMFDRKFAFVTLEDSTFEFPDITKGYQTKQDNVKKQERRVVMPKGIETHTQGVPKFFLQ
uniref:Large ribosomal subunit protein uL23m n=1 Tax=Crassostrea virginica TaxID=6565 RepID=A0A8B8EBS7_CRAVI|nr:39S ribosomal protein L23, mitochondrial-like [Crassostrea virginica]